MDSGRNFKITRAILVMTAILMSVVLGSVGVSHNQNPSTEQQPETVAKLSKQPASRTSNQPDKQQEGISADLTAAQHRAEKLTASDTTVHKSGTLTEDEVWTNEHTYETDDPVTVPEGRTLTITSGVVVKNTKAGGIIIEPGGRLNIVGTGDVPVAITSSKDDTVGLDASTDGASGGQVGDYGTAIHAQAGSKVDIRHLKVAYASTAFVLEGDASIADSAVHSSETAFFVTNGEVKLVSITIDSVETGVATTLGKVTFAGSMTNVAGKSIQACDWGIEGCSVNATYTNVNTEALSTLPVCGQVTLTSTLGSLLDGSLKAANCENTPPADPINPAA